MQIGFKVNMQIFSVRRDVMLHRLYKLEERQTDQGTFREKSFIQDSS